MPTTKTPPGPSGGWLFGSLKELRQDILATMPRWCRQYGDVVAFRLGPKPHVLVNHPDLIEQVLVTDNRHFIKHYGVRLLVPTVGNGLLTSEGDFWLRQRRMIQPTFQRSRMDHYAEQMIEHSLRKVSQWRSGEAIDVHEEMMQLTLSIVAKTLLDVDVVGPDYQVFAECLHGIMLDADWRLDSFVPLPYWVPSVGNYRLWKTVRRLNTVVHGIIRERRENFANRHDLLSLLIQARDGDETPGMTDRQLRDEIMTMVLAGHETTANALSWTWYLLSQHPDIEARLLDELQTVLEDRLPTPADVPRLVFTEAVVNEAMRLYPPAFLIGREAVCDVQLGEYTIPAKTTVLLSPWTTQRDGRFFEHPNQFDPDRWNEEMLRTLPKYAFFPFGGGPRKCIGNNFAMLEAVLIIATILPRYRFTLLADPPIKPWASITLRPKHGVRMVASSRAGFAAQSPSLK